MSEKKGKSFVYFRVLEKIFLSSSVIFAIFLMLYFSTIIACKVNFLKSYRKEVVEKEGIKNKFRFNSLLSFSNKNKNEQKSVNQKMTNRYSLAFKQYNQKKQKKYVGLPKDAYSLTSDKKISSLQQQIDKLSNDIKNYKENQKDLKTLVFLFSALITFIVMAFGYLEWGNLKYTLESFVEKLNEQKANFQKEKKELKNELKDTFKNNLNLLVRHQLEEIMLLTSSARKMLVGIYREGIKKSLESVENEIRAKCSCDVDLSDGIDNFYDLIRKHDILIRLFSEDKELVLSALYSFIANPFVEAEERLKILKSRYLNDNDMLMHINMALRLIEEIRLKNL